MLSIQSTDFTMEKLVLVEEHKIFRVQGEHRAKRSQLGFLKFLRGRMGRTLVASSGVSCPRLIARHLIGRPVSH